VVGALLVVAAAWAAVYFLSDARLNQKVAAPNDPVAVPTDITSAQRGQHLASAVATCTDCHGPNLAGKVLVDDPSMGRFVAPNLTRGRGGIGAALSNADMVRAIRYGVDPAGRQLLIMPSDNYNHFSDADLGAIISYIRAVPPIDTSLPANEIRAFGRIQFVLDRLPLQPAANVDRTSPRNAAPQPAVTAEYGRYLADAAGCPDCHGPDYSGGRMAQALPNTTAAANITPGGVGTWSEADFFRVMRTGLRPDGSHLNASMPWPYFAQMTDDELRAIWHFLQALPPLPTGPR
jgi:mono/diheme cytochrome c family protein